MRVNSVSILKIPRSFSKSGLEYNFVKNQADSVNFSGGTGAEGKRMRKNFSGMKCPCCGIKMITAADVRKALVLPPEAPSEKVIPILRKYEPNMHDVEQGVFQLMDDLSKKNPEYNLRQLLDTVRGEHLTGLHEEERKIIDRIRGIGGFLSADSARKLDRTLKDAEDFIRNADGGSTFKRRVFIAKVGDAVHSLPEKDAAHTIFELAHEMPRAGTSRNAFVVKYTEKKGRNLAEQNSHDIIQGLLSPSTVTVEHVKVRSPLIENGGGSNTMNNYILECSRDNNLRNFMPFWKFVKKHPEFYGKYLQEYLDEIISRLNNGELRGYEQYPLQISRTLRRQSKRQVNPDISGLKGIPSKSKK